VGFSVADAPGRAVASRRDAVAAAALLLAVQRACPLYVTRGAGLCYYGADLMGGWAAGVTFLFGVDMVILAALLCLSPGSRD
jgi:hypothetical protein